MKSFKGFRVGDIIIFSDKKEIWFKDQKAKKTPVQVVLAMMAVARYLKWIEGDKKNHTSNPSAKTTCSRNRTSYYVAGKEVLRAHYGKVVWAKFNKWQFINAVNYAFREENYTPIPENAYEISELFWVEKLPRVKVFEEEDFEEPKERLANFFEDRCKTSGQYQFEIETVMEESGIELDELLYFYITKKLGDTEINGMQISSAFSTVENDSMVISLY